MTMHAITPDEFPQRAARFLLPGPVAAIEVASAWPAAPRRAGVALICHPHPLYGGSMDNKVVTTLERVFGELGLATLRFNFRGVGRSGGEHDHGRGEGDDLAALAAWVRAVLPGSALWLAGFSFGSYVAARMARQLAAAQLVSVAPPVAKWDFAALPDPGCPWLVVQGEMDDVADPAATYQFVASHQPRPHLVRMPHTGHFFHGKLAELRHELSAALTPVLPALVA